VAAWHVQLRVDAAWRGPPLPLLWRGFRLVSLSRARGRLPSQAHRSITEGDAERAGREHQFPVERHTLHALAAPTERHVVDAGRVEGQHHAILSLGERPYRRGAEAEAEDAIEGNG